MPKKKILIRKQEQESMECESAETLSEPAGVSITLVATDRSVEIGNDLQKGRSLGNGRGKLLRRGRYKRYFPTSNPSFRSTVASIVNAAIRQVIIEDFGVLKLSKVNITTEIAHILGSLVTARAFCLAKRYRVTVGVGARGIRLMDAIGRTGLDIEICDSGTIKASVNTKSTQKHKSGEKESSDTNDTEAADDETTAVSPSGGGGGGGGGDDDDDDDKKNDVEKNTEQHIVVTRRNGVTHIHIAQLKIFIDIKVVEQLNMNPQQVINQLQGQLAELQDVIDSKTVEYKFIEDNKDSTGKS